SSTSSARWRPTRSWTGRAPRKGTLSGVFDVPLSALVAQVFTGLVLGGILVLMAIGLSLIFGLMTVVNFAHGAFYMLGAYVAFSLLGLTKSFWATLVLAPLVVGTLGFLVERLLIRRLYGRSPDDPLLLTFGLSLAMVEGVKLLWGKIGLTVDPPKQLSSAVDLGFMNFPVYRLFVKPVTAPKSKRLNTRKVMKSCAVLNWTRMKSSHDQTSY